MIDSHISSWEMKTLSRVPDMIPAKSHGPRRLDTLILIGSVMCGGKYYNGGRIMPHTQKVGLQKVVQLVSRHKTNIGVIRVILTCM